MDRKSQYGGYITLIVFIYGTTAEAIKIAPVARRLRERGIPFQQWSTNQHAHELSAVLPELGLGHPDRVIVDGVDGRPVKTVSDTVRWAARVLAWARRNRKPLRSHLPPHSIVIVHGDTITTVLGALIARSLKLPCAHIEAGLRSGSWRHPFPEELDRMIVGQLAQIHYTPSLEASSHLRKKKNVVFTHGNTAIDAILDHGQSRDPDRENYGVMLLHRFEFLSNEDFIRQTLDVISQQSEIPVKFFADEFGQELMRRLMPQKSPSVLHLQPKQSHLEFTKTLYNAEFVITDSGGVQAECALIGVPTLIHRKATEQDEGLGENIELSGWNLDKLRAFLTRYEEFRRPQVRHAYSPSDVIVEDLVSRGFAGA